MEIYSLVTPVSLGAKMLKFKGESRMLTAEPWDKHASSYDQERIGDPVYMSCTREAARLTGTGELLLNAGCGTGLGMEYLNHRQIVALDFSIESLKLLRRKYPDAMLVCGDVHNLPFKPDTFDTVLCANTLQHLRGDQRAEGFAEVMRMAPRIVISVHHYSRQKRRLGWIKEGKPGHAATEYIFRFSFADLQGYMPGVRIRAAGFYELLNIPWFGARLQNLIPKVLGGLLARLGCGHMLIGIVARRGRVHDQSGTQHSPLKTRFAPVTNNRSAINQ
jgi:ubiquinone/menaquinone biosynthesis C-methylase UbiE